jgi:hypothetical protein
MMKMDNIDVEQVEKRLERSFICQECANNGVNSFIHGIECGFRPKDTFQKCDRKSGKTHEMNANQKSLVMRKVDINALFAGGIDKIPKYSIEDIRNKLKRGDQLFLWRENVFSNTVMKYAHVVVYIGEQQVVHVAKSSGFHFLRSKFIKEHIDEVIEKDDKVSFGHQIPEFLYSINLRDKITERALACVEEPKLHFDYDYKQNCESFANLLTGNVCSCSHQMSSQEKNSPPAVKGVFRGI